MTNSVKDVTFSLKSLARSILVSMLSKKDATKIEKDLTFIKHELKVIETNTEIIFFSEFRLI